MKKFFIKDFPSKNIFRRFAPEKKRGVSVMVLISGGASKCPPRKMTELCSKKVPSPRGDLYRYPLIRAQMKKQWTIMCGFFTV